jgi:adenylosuccinate synthase
MEPKRQSLRPYAKAPELDLQSMTDAYLTYGHRIEQYITDTARLTWDVLDGGGDVLFEGAQATMLDIDHGTYPFVTSSNPVAGQRLDRHRRRARRTSTRSGASPRPTPRAWAPARSRPSSTASLADTLREAGGEYGNHHRPRPPRRLDRPRRPSAMPRA